MADPTATATAPTLADLRRGQHQPPKPGVIRMPDLVADLTESRDWWQDEAFRIERHYERLALTLGVVAVVGVVVAFWVGVLVG